MLLLTTWFGSFLLDGDKIVHERLFPSDAARLADRLALVEDWKVLEEERDLMGLADEVFVVEPRLERAGGNRTNESPPFLRSEDFGYGRDLLHAAMVDLAKRRAADVIVKGLRWFGVVEMAVFAAILLVALVYAWRKGALEWGS